MKPVAPAITRSAALAKADTVFRNRPALHDFPEFRKLTGGPLRPGGLEGTRQALALSGIKPPALLLDVGCGAGASLAFLQGLGFSCLGVDLSMPLLGEARSHGPVACAEAVRLPIASALLDGLLCECVLSLVQEKERALAEFARVLRPEGWLFLSDLVLLEPPPKNRPDPGPQACPQGMQSLCQLRAMVTEAGFAIRAEVDMGHALKALAAQMVWQYGSTEAFWHLWQDHVAHSPCHRPEVIGTKTHGYTLVVAQKK